ncbi:MAG: cache domain-containing protein [Acidobacteriia bacterium]|nr:cache domain-containing protein [Terriglobia bacterium]
MISPLRNVSLRGKITISFVLIVLCGTAISTFIGSRIITNAMLNEALEQVRHGLEAARMAYAARLEGVRKAITGAAAAEKLAAAPDSPDLQRMPQILSTLRKENDLDFLAFVDAKSGRVFRGSEAGAVSPPRSAPSFSDLLAGAGAGKVMASTEVLGRDALLQEDPTLAEQAHFKIVPVPMTTPDSRTDVDSGLVLLAAAPVATGSGLKGVLYGGILLNRNFELVDQINRAIFGGEQSAGREIGSVSIFMQDVRVATTVLTAPKQRAVGTRVSAEVARTVLSGGRPWIGRAYVVNDWRIAAYEPIRDHTGAVIGVLYVGMQEKPFLAVRTDMMLTFVIVAAVGVLVVLGLTYLITRSMIQPLEEIVAASNRIADGDLDHSVINVRSRDEIGRLADRFNKMVASIKTMKYELEEWGRTLEEKVNKRTEELVAVQNQMAQSAKLASLGRLAAGVAHEINNPLGGILTFGMLALEDCDDKNPLRPNLEIVIKQTMRCRETVKGLLDFARQSTAAASPTEVNQVVDKTLLLLQNQSIFQNVRTVRGFNPDLPPVLIDPGQLQQVVVNIALNAVDAMAEAGTLTVETDLDPQAQEVVIRISDTGKGIPAEILPLIFEPFFTTKKVGEGTGLGLSIVHGIVTRAGGRVEASSSSAGATFTIRLPVAREIKNGDARQEHEDAGDRIGQPADGG